jgi:hypothetical protein
MGVAEMKNVEGLQEVVRRGHVSATTGVRLLSDLIDGRIRARAPGAVLS